jgi:hypothetical protein
MVTAHQTSHQMQIDWADNGQVGVHFFHSINETIPKDRRILPKVGLLPHSSMY